MVTKLLFKIKVESICSQFKKHKTDEGHLFYLNHLLVLFTYK